MARFSNLKGQKSWGTKQTSQAAQTHILVDDTEASGLGRLNKSYHLNNALSPRLPSGRLTFPKWLRVLLQFKFGPNLATCLSVIE